jgi:hypothetical protein
MSFASTSGLTQSATVWTATPDGFGGFSFTAPVEILCRWEERMEEFIDRTSQQVVSSAARVFVDRDLSVNDWIFQGVSAAADPTLVDGAWPIRDFKKITDLRNVTTLRKVLL